jgi:uncharacterized alpha-E superfamily protein
MLSRVASHLYWLSRYLERAENMARILDVGQSLALLSGRHRDEGLAMEPLVITDTVAAFAATGKPASAENVAKFLAWDGSLASSIANCIQASRENARAVRGSITSEMWETINDTWLQLSHRRRARAEPVDSEFFDWVKERSHLFRGVTFATIRRDQPYHFVRLGTYIERADNTARILSVKQAGTEEQPPAADAVTDYYRLSAVLRSVSALEAYRDTYRDAIESRRVAELLIFSAPLPRSLRFCFDEIERVLSALPEQTGRQARRLASDLHARLTYGDLDEVYQTGLYRYLDTFVRDTNRVGDAIQSAYLEVR